MNAGSHLFQSLLANKPDEFQTNPVKLETASLIGNKYFINGASNQVKDKVAGLWFKAFDSDGNKIGEYINPSTIATKQKWKD